MDVVSENTSRKFTTNVPIPGIVVIFCGVPGSGKATIDRMLREELNAYGRTGMYPCGSGEVWACTGRHTRKRVMTSLDKQGSCCQTAYRDRL